LGAQVLDVLFQDGSLTQFNAPPAGQLLPNGVSSVAVTFDPSGKEVLDFIFQGTGFQLNISPATGLILNAQPLATV
jgi:hypothetical protein